MIDTAIEEVLERMGARLYAAALARFAKHHGWEVHTGARIFCLHRLDDPWHRRGRRCRHGLAHGPDVDGRNLDHLVWLRRGPARCPQRWALLSQPYGGADPSGTALHLGPAPYGLGTSALLYVGRTRTAWQRGDH